MLEILGFCDENEKRKRPEGGFTYAPIALALELNDADFRLVVDRALSQLFGSQEFHDLYVKWFGQPNESVDTFFKLSTLPE